MTLFQTRRSQNLMHVFVFFPPHFSPFTFAPFFLWCVSIHYYDPHMQGNSSSTSRCLLFYLLHFLFFIHFFLTVFVLIGPFHVSKLLSLVSFIPPKNSCCIKKLIMEKKERWYKLQYPWSHVPFLIIKKNKIIRW